MADLHVSVEADIDGAGVAGQNSTTTIPPDYTQVDIDALVVRTIEVTAFRTTREAYGRTPTLRALIAATARLKALEDLFPEVPEGEVRERLREILDATNEEAIARWGEDPEGG